MGADVAREVGGEEEGDGGDAGDDSGVEAAGAWARVEEVAEWAGEAIGHGLKGSLG